MQIFYHKNGDFFTFCISAVSLLLLLVLNLIFCCSGAFARSLPFAD